MTSATSAPTEELEAVVAVGLFSSKKGDRTPEEREVARMQHKAYRDAGNAAAAKLSRSDPLIHDMLNEAIIDAEQDVPWWRR